MNALLSGLGGAVAITLIHETVRQVVPQAPRMDLLGMQALSKGLLKGGKLPPSPHRLYWYTMAGDVAANTLYYSLAGLGSKQHAVRNGALLGLAAGIGGVLLPGPMGLSKAPSSRSLPTALMTVGLYLAGGLITGWLMQCGREKRKKGPDPHLL